MEVPNIQTNKKKVKKRKDMKKFFDAAGKIKIDKESIRKLREASKI